METSLGERIQIVIKSKKLKQAEFAKSLGVSANYINLIVNGKKNTISEILAKLIEEKYGYAAEWVLYGGIDSNVPQESPQLARIKSETIKRIKALDDHEAIAVLAFLNSLDTVNSLNKP